MRHLKSQGHRPSSPQKKKANTTPPLTPSPPPNKHPFPQPIPLTSPPPYQDTPRPLPLLLPSPPPKSPTIYPPPYTLPMPHLTTHTTSLRPTSPLITSPPPFPLYSTIPSPHPLPPHQPRRRHPFTDFIANTPFLVQWEPFTLDRYTGETDPDEHLKVYITHVALYTSQDTVFCKAFPTTLKGPTLKWFTTLPPYLIDNFDALSHIFSTHFAGSRPHQTTTIPLLGIRQEQGEPLRAFINRFSKAALRTPHFNQEMILQCMALTLQPDPFANNVYLYPPAYMHELKLRAADYVRMEEMQTLHTKFCNDYAATTANPTPPPPALIPDHESPANPALLDMLPLMSPDPTSLMRPYKLTSSRHHARRPFPQCGYDQILSLPPQPWPHYRGLQSTSR